ncbi:MAG: radical SAM protein [Candidatus Zixiibacteriota bacterium]
MKQILRKTLLYKTGVEYGDYSINHIEGCAHGCRYPCYAMLMSKRFGRTNTYQDWRKPKLVGNAIELLHREIPRMKDKIRFVHLCFMSDPFMVGYPDVTDMSLRIIRLLNDHGIKVTTLTKGIYPADILHYGTLDQNEYGISFVSNSASYLREYEPYSAKWFMRVRSLERLSNQGAKTWVSMEPYPTPNIADQDINELLERIGFVDKIVFGRLNYNVRSKEYEGHRDYYNDLCSQVVSFCESHGIEYHLKHGTDTRVGAAHICGGVHTPMRSAVRLR